MGLSYKAKDILSLAKLDAVKALEKLNLTWDLMGAYMQNAEVVKAIVEPMLAPHIAQGVRLSYSKDNELWAPVFNVSWDVCNTMLAIARRKIDDEKQAEKEARIAVVESNALPGKRLLGYIRKGQVSSAVVEQESSGYAFVTLKGTQCDNYCVPVYADI